MENRICVKCQKVAENGLPLCDPCRESLKDFVVLASYLNGFNGSKDDLFWIINSEISSRQTSVIGNCRIMYDYAAGTIELIPIEPSSSTLKTNPRLWDRFVYIRQTIEEIKKLYRALRIAKKYYENKEDNVKSVSITTNNAVECTIRCSSNIGGG